METDTFKSIQKVFSSAYRLSRRIRMGPSNKYYSRNLSRYSKLSLENQKEWILEKVRGITIYAFENNQFYRDYYISNDFDPDSVRSFKDIVNIPIVDKEILNKNMDKWLQDDKSICLGNTGGTSGQPLKFSISKQQSYRESFYISHLWKQLGYHDTDIRAIFRGKNIGKSAWVYIPEKNAFFINVFLPYTESSCVLKNLFHKEQIKFLHGYPSAIYNFALYCIDEDTELRALVNENLVGILLGSEYPAKQYREVIEKAFPVPNISWYGHSEMVILAAENTLKFNYKPYHTYGYCEGVVLDDGLTHIVGTSYDNHNSPFIRYDTGDSIIPDFDEGLLNSFSIDQGRIGEFILDYSKNPVSLTAMIFGRHHKAFEMYDYIQVSQDYPGRATVHITSKETATLTDVADLFDFANINIEFDYVFRETPIRTNLGKVPLLISGKIDIN